MGDRSESDCGWRIYGEIRYNFNFKEMESDNLTLYQQQVVSRSFFRFVLGVCSRLCIKIKYDYYVHLARKRGAVVGKNVTLNKQFARSCTPKVSIGDNSIIGSSKIRCPKSKTLKIGSNVIIGREVNIFPGGHNINSTNFEVFRESGTGLTIEDYAWICPYSSIMPGVKKIGSGAVINTTSSVFKSVKPMKVVVGNPAVVVDDRDCVPTDFPINSLSNNDLELFVKTYLTLRKR